MKIAKTGDTYPIICANDYRDRTYTIDYILSAAKTAGYNSVMLLHTMWNHEREFYVIAYIDVVKDNNDIYLYDRQRSGSSILDAGAYMGSTNPNYSNPMVSASESSDGLQSRGSWTFVSTTYQERTYYEISYDTYEPIFYTDMPYSDIYINNVKVDINKSGGAGSGYIGNPLLSNKKMVGYNVPTSSAESTKTESVDEASENPVSGKPKIGNGFARIKFLRDWAPPAEYQELLDLINGANFTEKYYMTDNWITKLSDSATSGATASIDNGFKSYSYARYTDTGNSNVWYTNPSQQWNDSSYSNNKYVAGTASWEGTTEPCTCGIVAFSKLNINVNKTINDNYTFTLNNLSPLAVYSFYGTKYYIFRVRYNPSDSPTGWRSFSVSYTELPSEYLGSVSYTGTLENCLKVIAMNFRNVNIYVDGVLWSSAVR